MSDERESVEFETEQLPEFLDHIAREEARELDRLRREYRSSMRSVRTEARRRSRQYHRRACEEARARIESQHMRKVSRARNEFRRRRWEALRDLRERAREKIWTHLRERWRQPDRQLSWCLYWLKQCERLEGGDGIEIRLGSAVHESTMEGIRQWIAGCGTAAKLAVDESLGEGIVVRRGERSIDGLLRTQLEYLLESVHGELAGWLHDDNAPGKSE